FWTMGQRLTLNGACTTCLGFGALPWSCSASGARLLSRTFATPRRRKSSTRRASVCATIAPN
ncbi:hypothetical protein H4S02_011864, partial [Coemansia sp. RSA 2611]